MGRYYNYYYTCDGYDMRSGKQFIKGVTWKLTRIPEMGRASWSHTRRLSSCWYKDEVECKKEFRFGRRAVVDTVYNRIIHYYHELDAFVKLEKERRCSAVMTDRLKNKYGSYE